VIAMSRSDLTQQRLREQEEWQKRGVAGTVSAVDPGANAFTIKSGRRTSRSSLPARPSIAATLPIQ